jgi:hypothetical protein
MMMKIRAFAGRSCWRFATLRWFGTGPLPHPTSQTGYAMGGRVGERAGAVLRNKDAVGWHTTSQTKNHSFPFI